VRLEAESILINVAGRLLMFQRDRSVALGKQTEANDRRVRLLVIYSLKLVNISFHIFLLNTCILPFVFFIIQFRSETLSC
jgi:hypothetical protein